MSLTLRQTRATPLRIDFDGLLPDALCALSADQVAAIQILQGNTPVRLDSLFGIDARDDGLPQLDLHTLGDSIDNLGKQMRTGTIRVRGDVGLYAGRGMLGGELHIDGNAGDFCGSGLRAGILRIAGNAGDCLGAPAGGELRGQQGGLIHVRGNVGARAGERQRRGICLIEGDAGELAAYRMIAGTLYIGGRTGPMAGHGMRRGSLLLQTPPQALDANFRSNGMQTLGFLPLLLQDLRRLADGSLDALPSSPSVHRYLGDVAADGRGEILILG